MNPSRKNPQKSSKKSVAEALMRKSLQAVHPNHLLVPIDFSKPSIHALGVALEFASRFGSKLTLLHVVEAIPPGAHVLFETLEQDWEGPARERLSEFIQAHVPANLSVDAVVRLGKPSQEIVNLAESHNVDLVVISSHGYTGLVHLLIGSTAEQVVRHAPCPVLVVRGWEEEEGRPPFRLSKMKKLLLPTDFSNFSFKAFPVAAALAQEFHLKIVVAYVLSVTPATDYPHLIESLKIPSIQKRVVEKLEEVRTRRLPKDLEVETRVDVGDASHHVCELAKSESIDLIVLTTHGYTGLKHFLLGSNAERIVRHATCPVLVVR